MALTPCRHGLYCDPFHPWVRESRSGVRSMSTLSPTVAPVAPDWLPSPLYRLSLEQYEAMVESGVFTARDRCHLINGFLVAKMTQNPPHTTADDLCGAAL